MIRLNLGSKRSQGAELSPEQQAAIIYALENKLSNQTKLSLQFGCHRNTIANTFKRYLKWNDIKSRPQNGRPQKFTSQSRQLIKILARQNPFWFYQELTSKIPGSPYIKTIQQILKQSGIVRWLAKRKIPINRTLASKRRAFARHWRREFRTDTIKNWIFSDKCSVQRTSNSSPRWCWRLKSEAFQTDLVNPKIHVKDISQMVWGTIWLGGCSKLIVMERDTTSERSGYSWFLYINTLEEDLLPIYEPGKIFQQDNAKIHIAKDTQKWFESHSIYVED